MFLVVEPHCSNGLPKKRLDRHPRRAVRERPRAAGSHRHRAPHEPWPRVVARSAAAPAPPRAPCHWRRDSAHPARTAHPQPARSRARQAPTTDPSQQAAPCTARGPCAHPVHPMFRRDENARSSGAGLGSGATSSVLGVGSGRSGFRRRGIALNVLVNLSHRMPIEPLGLSSACRVRGRASARPFLLIGMARLTGVVDLPGGGARDDRPPRVAATWRWPGTSRSRACTPRSSASAGLGALRRGPLAQRHLRQRRAGARASAAARRGRARRSATR